MKKSEQYELKTIIDHIGKDGSMKGRFVIDNSNSRETPISHNVFGDLGIEKV